MTLPFRSLLVLAPHADDETLGAGGLLHRAHREGVSTIVVCMVMQPDREQEMSDACARLGVQDLEVMFRGERVPYADDRAIDQLDALVQDYRPDALALPYAGATHQEHRAASAIGMSVVRPLAEAARHRAPAVFAYEEAADAWSTGSTAPTMYVTLEADDMDAKVEAMASHMSQGGVEFGIRSERSIRALAALRGSQAGTRWAEAFQPLLAVL